MKQKISLEISSELKEVVPDYLDSMKEEVDLLTQLLLDDEFDQIEQLGHRMKGHGGGYGFHFISECGSNIEKMAKAKDETKIELWIGKLREFLNDLDVIYVDEY